MSKQLKRQLSRLVLLPSFHFARSFQKFKWNTYTKSRTVRIAFYQKQFSANFVLQTACKSNAPTPAFYFFKITNS